MERRTFRRPGKSVVDFHLDAVCAEVLVDKPKHGLESITVLLFKTDDVVEDLAYSPEGLS